MTARGPVLRALAAAVGLVAVTATVVAGGATRLDQYAVDHWIHGLERGDADSPLLSVHQLYPHLGTPLEAACSLWTFPGSALVSGLVLVAGCWLLARRGRRDAALAWAAAWIVANALEVLGKGLLERPALRFDGGVLHNFDSSFPSGHALRAVLAAALVAAVWPRAALPAALWAAVVLPALVVNGDHTPSDVVGGALLALFAAAAVATWLAARAPARGEASRRIALRSAVAEDG